MILIYTIISLFLFQWLFRMHLKTKNKGIEEHIPLHMVFVYSIFWLPIFIIAIFLFLTVITFTMLVNLNIFGKKKGKSDA